MAPFADCSAGDGFWRKSLTRPSPAGQKTPWFGGQLGRGGAAEAGDPVIREADVGASNLKRTSPVVTTTWPLPGAVPAAGRDRRDSCRSKMVMPRARSDSPGTGMKILPQGP